MRKRIAHFNFALLFFFLYGNIFFAQEKSLFVNDKAPSFCAIDDKGEEWKLSDHNSEFVVLYFYPAAMTGGCTKQACSYRDSYVQFRDKNIEVVGVSGDNIESLKAFRKAHQLNFTLLSDSTGSVAESYGVPFSEGGKLSRNIDDEDVTLIRGVTIQRWTFVVAPGGSIIYLNNKVNAEEDSRQVLEIIENHQNHKVLLQTE